MRPSTLFRWHALPLAALLGACAALPASVSALNWQDDWGDRGRQVMARDHAQCAELLESKRSQMQACLLQRGWRLGD